MDDLIPPAPPGETKKEGFLKRIFSKKETQESTSPPKPQSELQERLKPKPSKLEEMQVGQDDIDLKKIRQQLGLESALPPTNTNTQDDMIIDDFRPRYTPMNIELPNIKHTKVEYDKSDFTKDPQFEIPKKETITYKPKKEVHQNKDIDWTTDPNHANHKRLETPKAIIKEPTVDNLKNLDPELLSELKDLDTSLLEEGGLEKELKEDVPIDFTKDPEQIKKAETQATVTTPEIKEETTVIDLTPKEQTTPEHEFLSQPVIKFTNELKEKLRAQVAEEEKQKLLHDFKFKEEVSKEEREKLLNDKNFKEEAKKEVREEEREKLLNDQSLKDEVKDKVRKEEREKLFKELEQEQKRLAKKIEEFELEKAEYEEKKKIAKNIDEERKNLENVKDDIKKERELLLADQERDKHITTDIANLRAEYKKIEDELKLANETIALSKKMEKNLEDREKALHEAQSKLDGMERIIREKGFSEFLSSELTRQEIEYPVTEKKEDLTKEPHAEIFVLADECRNLIWENKLDDAKDKYVKARELYHSMLSQGEENEHIYLIIRELYDDLNLAILK